MENYTETRKELLKQLRALGVQAPAERFPVIHEMVGGFETEVAQRHQIEEMRQALVDIDLDKEWNSRQ